MLWFAGVTAIATKTAGVTISITGVDVTPENIAVMVVEPMATDVASPFEPDVLLMVAISGFDEVQVALVVKSFLVPSSRVASAANC